MHHPNNTNLKLKVELTNQFKQILSTIDNAVKSFVGGSDTAQQLLKDNAVYNSDQNIQVFTERVYDYLGIDGCKANLYLDLILLDPQPHQQNVLQAVFCKLINRLNLLSTSETFTDFQLDPQWAMFTAQLTANLYQIYQVCKAIINRAISTTPTQSNQDHTEQD